MKGFLQDTNELLSFWESIHGKLADKWKITFLESKEAAEIISHPTSKVFAAVELSPKLDEILSYLRAGIQSKPRQIGSSAIRTSRQAGLRGSARNPEWQTISRKSNNRSRATIQKNTSRKQNSRNVLCNSCGKPISGQSLTCGCS